MLSKEDFENVYKAIKANATVPTWFVYNYKTVLTRNITIEDWNRLYEYLKRALIEIDGYDKIIEAIYEHVTALTGKVEELTLTVQTHSEQIQELVLKSDTYVTKDLSELPSASISLDNGELTLYADANGTPSRLNVDSLRDRIIKTVDTETTDLKTNQYVFEKI